MVGLAAGRAGGDALKPDERCSTWQCALGSEAVAQGRLCLVASLFSGKSYSLTYTRVQVEDAAEIKFVAEKAESRAQLTVKGNYAFHANTA